MIPNWLKRFFAASINDSRKSRRQQRASRKHFAILRVQQLEDRTVPTIFAVTNIGDNSGVDPSPFAGTGTLRQALIDANATSGLDTINFAIGTGVQTIAPLSALPTITDAVVIDGATQPGFAGTPIIELDGSGAGTAADGLIITASDSIVRGLVINRFRGNGISITGGGATSNVIAGNFIGTDVSGFIGLGNGYIPYSAGVAIFGGARGNIVGGTTAADRNVVSGNDHGVILGSSDNIVEGNYIGTDATGSAAIANGRGVAIYGAASNNTVGGGTMDAGNVISGNSQFGVFISNPSFGVFSGSGSGNLVAGNLIGTDATGTLALGNGTGIRIDLANNTVGGTSAAYRNIISGNDYDGVDTYGDDADGIMIQGNYIGTDITGNTDLGNRAHGVKLYNGSDHCSVGGTAPGAGNLISGNDGNGIVDTGSTVPANLNLIQGNLIGTNVTGTTALGNSGSGIVASEAFISIGGTTGDARNVIGGNGGFGIDLSGNAGGDFVQGNYIGTDITGSSSLANGSGGIRLGLDRNGDTVGGTAPGARNVISGNNSYGISITSSTSHNHVVEGNYIGVAADGVTALGNGGGILISNGAHDNTIGGTTAAARNIISGNAGNGIIITGNGTSGNAVQGNYIGTDVTGTTALANGTVLDASFNDGVVIDAGASNNVVGGTVAGAGNVISGNADTGINILGPSANNKIQGNLIGTNASGTSALVNHEQGILIADNGGRPTGTLIGGDDAADGSVDGIVQARNVIVGPRAIRFYSAGAGTVIQGNYLNADVTGSVLLLAGDSVFIQDTVFVTVGGTTAGAGNLVGSDLELSSGADLVVLGNTFGLDATGHHRIGQGRLSINADLTTVSDGMSAAIGGTTPGARNVIVGPILIGNSGQYSHGTVFVQGNYIGTDVTGTAAFSNLADDGIYVNASDVTIGGIAAGAGNVIAGFLTGIELRGYSPSGVFPTRNVIQGNFIGTDGTGTLALGNGTGILIRDRAHDNTIGGTTAAARNIISGNTGNGITITGSGTTGNVVEGNYVGTDATGTTALSNGTGGGITAGVEIAAGANHNTIGGSMAGARNVISGNNLIGVQIGGLGTVSNLVAGNYIGVDVTGNVALGNGDSGVVLIDGASGNVIGGAVAGAGNVISGNFDGLSFYGAGSGNMVQGNLIGTNAAGTAGIGNTCGIVLQSRGTIIGGTASGAGNVISGNANGIFAVNDSGGTIVQGNLIGLNAAGSAVIGNNNSGIDVRLLAGETITIGGTSAAARNVISGGSSNSAGIACTPTNGQELSGTAIIQGNFIGTDVTGNIAIGNFNWGILVNNTQNNVIGGPSAGAANVISGNNTGVYLTGVNATGNVVAGNFIGTNADGTAALGNGSGVVFESGASSNTIGGTTAGSANTIAFNAGTGVVVDGANTVGNAIRQNLIYNNGGNPQAIQLSNGGNANQPAPVLTHVQSDGATTSFSGTLTATPLTTYALDFFDGPTAGQASSFLGSATVSTDASGLATFNIVLNVGVPIGSYVAATATDPNGNTSELSLAPQVVNPPSSLMGFVFKDFNDDGQIDFGEKGISGVTVRLQGTDSLGRSVDLTTTTDGAGMYQFVQLASGTYTITETQPAGYTQGINTVGTAGGSVSGDVFSVNLGAGADGMNYNFGERPVNGGGVASGQTARVGFWNNKNGQALIKSLNGGATSKQLGNWLAATFKNIFGANAGSNNLTGMTNAQVAAAFQQKFVVKGQKLDAQVMATALSVYVTNQRLAGTVAATYGFQVTQEGVGIATFNIGSDGAAVGKANGTVMNVLDILLAADALSANGTGLLYGGNTAKRNAANELFSAIDEAGGI